MIVDLWVNVLSPEGASEFLARPGFSDIETFFGTSIAGGVTQRALLDEMDRLGVDRAVLNSGLSTVDTAAAGLARKHPDRLALAVTVDDPQRPRRQSAEVRARAADDAVVLVRVTPLVHQYPLNHALYYPVYATCEELGIPVSINIGVPGPRVRSACQHPSLLEDVLIDFPDLVVIGAHMGHPYEELLIEYMLKWPNLYLSNSAYSARYLHPSLVRFMASWRGRGRLMFASDHPFLPLERALPAARQPSLPAEALDDFVGNAAARVLKLVG